MNLTDAQIIAGGTIAKLLPYCQRIEVAGSVRRQSLEVGDIELVATPKMIPTQNIFGEKVGEHSLLNDRKLFERFGIVKKAGQRYVQVELWQGINLDLFVVLPPAQWGVIYTIRTGPPEFSKWIVTPRSKGGAMHNGWRCEDGRIWDGQTELVFTEEFGFFEWLDIGHPAPRNREAKWNYFGKDYR